MMSTETAELRWGFVSCGKISNDFALAVARIRSPRHKLVAVASKTSLESAQKFAKKFNIPKAYGNYEDLFADPDINAVYVANLNPDHIAAALAAINAGKAVLVEKPLTMKVEDTKALIEASHSKGVLLVEAVWSRFNPIYDRLREILKTNKPVAVQVNFNVSIAQIDRISRSDMGGGAVFDIGVYAFQLVTMVFGGAAPCKVASVGFLTSDGACDLAESVALEYDNGRHASVLLDGRFGCPEICGARIFFYNGSEFSVAALPGQFWSPTRLELTKADGTVVVEEHPIYPNVKTDDGLDFVYQNSQGLAYEAEGFADAFQKWVATRNTPSVVVEHEFRTHNDSLVDANIMGTVFTQLKARVAGLCK